MVDEIFDEISGDVQVGLRNAISVDAQVRKAAVKHLGNVARSARNDGDANYGAIIDVILNAVRDEDPCVRGEAVKCLTQNSMAHRSNHAQAVFDAIAQAAGDLDPSVRWASLAYLGGSVASTYDLALSRTQEVFGKLLTAVSDPTSDVRFEAIKGLAMAAAAGSCESAHPFECAAFDATVAATQDENANVRMIAVSHLCEACVAGSSADSSEREQAAFSAVLAAASDADADIREVAISSLGDVDFGPKPEISTEREKAVFATLLAAADDPDDAVRAIAFSNLHVAGVGQNKLSRPKDGMNIEATCRHLFV